MSGTEQGRVDAIARDIGADRTTLQHYSSDEEHLDKLFIESGVFKSDYKLL